MVVISVVMTTRGGKTKCREHHAAASSGELEGVKLQIIVVIHVIIVLQ
jgi:hypothetical protein